MHVFLPAFTSVTLKKMSHRRIPVPQGYVKPGFENVKEALRQNLESQTEKACNFAAYYQGELVVNLWAGFADYEGLRPWKVDTFSFFFSTTKSASAIVIAHLVDRGCIKYEDKVAQYWPEFAQNGKEDITLEQLISNQAGLAELEEDYEIKLLRDDPQELGRLLAKQRPLWKPGEGHGYHPMTFGLYLDQIVRRVDPKRRNLAEYFKEEIAEPFDIEFHIGLNKEHQYRTTRLVLPLENARTYYQTLSENFHGKGDIIRLTLRNPRDWRRTHSIHDPDLMELPLGSSHGIGTALAVAKLHGILANGTDQSGRRLLSHNLIQRFQKPLSWGVDKTYGMKDIYSLGMSLLPVVEGNEVNYMFGHGGLGGQYGAADCKYKVGWAYVTNHLNLMSSIDGEKRWPPLLNALYDCIHKLEGVTTTRKMYKSFSEFSMPKDSKL